MSQELSSLLGEEAVPDRLHDSDALAWGEHQAVLLKRLAAGEAVNEPVDWAHVIEEIADVGLSELRACRSLLAQAMAHLLKLHLWPESDATAHWRAETAAFLAGARRSFTPSMRQRIDLDGLWADALYEIRAQVEDATQVPPLPEACPFSLDDCLRDRRDPRELLALLAASPVVR
jgi:hypothetical protein